MVKAAVFIDAGYLSAMLSANFKKARIDHLMLSNLLVGEIPIEPKAWRYRTYYFDALPYLDDDHPTAEDRERRQKHASFLEALDKLDRFQVVQGRMEKRMDAKGQPVYNQKRVDVLLAVELTQMAWQRHVDFAVLVTGDSDFVPAVEAARKAGVSVILRHGQKSAYPHRELIRAVDTHQTIGGALIEKVTLQPASPKP